MNDLLSSLNNWHALHALSNTMLNLAHSGKWDELIEQEVKYVTLVETIARNPVSPGNIVHQEQARQLLTKVLGNEAELRTLLQQRMDELRELIDQTGRQKSVSTTYGKLSGNILFPHDFNQ
ncbi:flagella biosynthesis regulatory protein FliT [Siccibacter colletis]|uniref:Flagellar protein FliT n=1 Tax=Siccibacter colletis TaxID=1505757 RepID=A0ABY6J9V3_9ENTR|nr:flagella biosynthesis regulatory protein FliT [Siccibacter colletis]UYU30622.1 flagella biosynthesis regulatory protein FliT [Siccibacter colletis]WNN47169.1 flagella biosynthesis regulatory protein FliT [Siccibacter colletis]